MRRSVTILVSLLLTFFALAAAGCGGDDESASDSGADEWAAGFCGAVTTWQSELEAIVEGFSDPSSLSVDAIKEAADDAADATDQFVEDVRALGAPDTEAGQEVEDSVDSLTDTVEEEKGNAEAAVDDVSSIADVPAAITAIGASVAAMRDSLQETLDAIQNADPEDELRTAFEQADACGELTG